MKLHLGANMWLGVCCSMVLLMVLVGGLTRLTGSGLSITEWRPVTGVIPPMSREAWLQEQEKYMRTPEYRHITIGMSLEDFQRIYLIEYVHRLLGRILGAVFCVPLLYFVIRRKIRGTLAIKLCAVALLGGAQGAMGWFMVKSGLADIPYISHYRLAGHLFLTVLIFSVLWHSFLCGVGVRSAVVLTRGKFFSAATVVVLVTLQIVLGALVAGLDAGMIYNTFPLMGGMLVPEELLSVELWRGEFLYNPTAVQFLHRLGALVVVLCAGLLLVSTRTRGVTLFLACIVAQFLFGVATLLSVVNIYLASMHQVAGFIVLAAGIYMLCEFRVSDKGLCS
ncbi:MAG: COX15/CtaA family protein [Anaplasma sp.]